MKKLIPVIAIIIALNAAIGCRRTQRLDPYGWRALGGEFDSITMKLENQVWNDAPVESIKLNIGHLEQSLRNDTSNSRAKRARIHYWRARALYAASFIDSAVREARAGCRIVDTVADYYDYLRLTESALTYEESDYEIDIYLKLVKRIDYARSIGDPVLLANGLRTMGSLMSSLGLYSEALGCYSESDSLSDAVGFSLVSKKNKINVASTLFSSGDSAACVDLLKSLQKDPDVMADIHTRNLVYRNIYAFTGDVDYLGKCYRDLVANQSRRGLRGFIASQIARSKILGDDPDSAIFYAQKAMGDLPYITDPIHRAVVMRNKAMIHEYQGQYDSSLYYLNQFMVLVDSINLLNNHTDVLRMRLGEAKMKYERDVMMRNITLGAVVAGALLAAIFLWGWLKRRRLRRNLEQLQSELEMERLRNTIAASSLTITEKDNILHTLQSELGRMRRLGAISADEANNLESTIRSHLVENDSQEMFRDMFDSVNPEFSQRLRRLCPDMAENTVTIASYIMMGLDTKRIARLLFIKQTSVFQARWRLRQRLRLAPGASLRAALQELNARRRL